MVIEVKSLAGCGSKGKRADIWCICGCILRHLSACMTTNILGLRLGGLMIFLRNVVRTCFHEFQKVHHQLRSGGRTVGRVPSMSFCKSPGRGDREPCCLYSEFVRLSFVMLQKNYNRIHLAWPQFNVD